MNKIIKMLSFSALMLGFAASFDASMASTVHSTLSSSSGENQEPVFIEEEKDDNPIYLSSIPENPPILQAIREKDLEKVKAAVEAGADPDGYANGRRFILDAIYNGDLSIVQYLISAGAKLRKKEGLLISAVRAPNGLDMIKCLVENGVDVNAPDYLGETPLQQAVLLNKYEIVKFLLENGAKVKKPFSEELEIAITKRNLPMAKILRDHGASISVEDLEEGLKTGQVKSKPMQIPSSPTMSYSPTEMKPIPVVMCGDFPCSPPFQPVPPSSTLPPFPSVTISATPRAPLPPQKQLPAFIKAEKEDNPIRLSSSSVPENPPILQAIRKKDLKKVKAAVEAGADPDGYANGHRFILDAIYSGNLSIVKYLISAGAKLRKKEGLLIAAIRVPNGLEMIKCLVENGVNVNAPDYFGKTPLYAAVENNKYDIVKYLLDHGAKVQRPFSKELEIAVKNQNRRMGEILIKHGASFRPD